MKQSHSIFNIKKISISFATITMAICTIIPTASYAQDTATEQQQTETRTLFPYPVAPESLASMGEKSNYLIEHFWDSMNLKSKEAVDQNLLNEAFQVYSVPMRFADKEKVDTSVDKLIAKLDKNPVLLFQFTKAAEEALYSPRAAAWIDEIYLKFLAATVANKKLPDSKTAKYKKQLASLEKTIIGMLAPEFKFTDRDGKEATYFPMATPTMLIFCNPKLPDWRMSRMKMETNLKLRQAVDKGQVNVIFIVSGELSDWKEETSNYPEKWIVGYAPEISSIYDLRLTPSIYVIDGSGEILIKNVTPAQGVDTILDLVK